MQKKIGQECYEEFIIHKLQCDIMAYNCIFLVIFQTFELIKRLQNTCELLKNYAVCVINNDL